MPKLALKIDWVSTLIRISPGTIKAAKPIPAMSVIRLPIALPNTRK